MNAFKLKYDNGCNEQILFDYYKIMFGREITYDEFQEKMSNYMDFSEEEKKEVGGWLLDKFEAF